MKSELPDVYHSLLPQFLLDFNFQETELDCQNCLMAKTGKYGANLKCCTFHPFVPNYMVGMILASDSKQGQSVIKERVKGRDFILPIGLIPSLKHQVEFNGRKEADFGNRKDWLCPFYDRGANQCSIWINRGSVCTSFFCQSKKADLGLRYWQTLLEYLHFVEMALLEESMVQNGFSPRIINQNLDFVNRHKATKNEKSWESLPVEVHHLLWSDWKDQPFEFFENCRKFVAALSRKEFIVLTGDYGKNLQNNLKLVIAEMNG